MTQRNPPGSNQFAPVQFPAPAKNAFSSLIDALNAGQGPDVGLCRAALAECLAAAPPPDNRLGSIIGFIVKSGARVDWTAYDLAVERWCKNGLLDRSIIRRICDAALAGGRSIDAALRAATFSDDVAAYTSETNEFVPDLSATLYRPVTDIEHNLRRSAATRPAEHAREKATYVAALAGEIYSTYVDDLVDPLTYLFAARQGEPIRRALQALRRIRTPLPGFPFLGERSGDDHFFFLTDSYVRAADARKQGVSPIPVVAVEKSGSAFMTTALSTILNVPAGSISLSHSFGVPAWLNFAARFPIALHDHMLPLRENVASLRHAGCKKMVIHVRDPRQAVVSLAHHVIAEKFVRSPTLAVAYESRGFDGLVDCIVERQTGVWLENWLAEAELAGLEVRVTTYEALRANSEDFLNDVLEFLSPSARRVCSMGEVLARLRAGQSRGENNFRKGTSDEWRSVLTKRQAEMIAARSGPAYRRLYPDLVKSN